MTDNQCLEQIEQRLEAMEAMLKELIRLAHFNWMYKSQEEKDRAIKEAEERYKDLAFYRFYKSEESESAEVKKGEMEADRIPQKGRVVKRDRSKGAPDY